MRCTRENINNLTWWRERLEFKDGKRFVQEHYIGK